MRDRMAVGMKIIRLIETLDPSDRALLARDIHRTYAGAMTGAERMRRLRDARASQHELQSDASGDASYNGSVTHTRYVFPSSSTSEECSEETETSNTTAKLERQERQQTAARLIDFLNEKAGRSFRKSAANRDLICARLASGITEQDCRGVIARKVREWKGTEYAKYLRPETLFNRTKLESYLGEREPEHGDVS